uniref:Uncharacterized protein n=1 Tax=Zea mays TaxID=4577 RepID=C4J740_MAIZE|nr:unknown [Zea mays]
MQFCHDNIAFISNTTHLVPSKHHHTNLKLTSTNSDTRNIISVPSTAENDLGLFLFFLLLLVLLILGSGILVLLILGHQVVHVTLCLGELHLIHTLACVPVQESLPPEHGRELLADAAEHLLDGG